MIEENIGPDTLIDRYHSVYRLVYGQHPRADYIGNQWFEINGEMVHYRMFVDEIDQLRDLAYKKRRRDSAKSNKSLVSRLINKLRLM